MKIYNYNTDNGEFLSEGLARVNPLEEGKYLLPANATFDTPIDSEEGKAVCYIDGEWVLEDDYRGETVYDNEGNPSVVDYIGVIKDGFALVNPMADSILSDYIQIYRKERESEPVSNGSGDDEITVIPNLRTMFTLETLDNAGNGVSAYSAENGTFDMTATQVTNLNNACKLHIAKLFIAQGAVKSAHTTTPYTTIAAIETAFDNAYNS